MFIVPVMVYLVSGGAVKRIISVDESEHWTSENTSRSLGEAGVQEQYMLNGHAVGADDNWGTATDG